MNSQPGKPSVLPDRVRGRWVYPGCLYVTINLASPLPIHQWCCYWRSRGNPEGDDEASPQPGVVAAIVLLVHVMGEIGLQDEPTEALANQTADGDLALLGVTVNWRVEISGAERDHAELPVAELPGGRQVDVEEVGIAAIQCKRRRARRQLRPSRDVVKVRAPDDIRSQVQLVAGVTQGKALIERGVAPSHFAVHVNIGTEQVAEPPIVTEVPRQLPRDQGIVDAAQVGGAVDANLDHWTREHELHPAAEDRPRGRPSDHRDINAD